MRWQCSQVWIVAARLTSATTCGWTCRRPAMQLADGLLLLGEVLLAGLAVLAQFVDFLLEGVPRRLRGQEGLAGSLDQLGDAALALGYFFQSKVGLLEGDQSVEVLFHGRTGRRIVTLSPRAAWCGGPTRPRTWDQRIMSPPL